MSLYEIGDAAEAPRPACRKDMKENWLKFADPWTIAAHWKGLNERDMLERHLLSSNTARDPTDIVTIATAAADAFIEIHSTPPAAERTAR